MHARVPVFLHLVRQTGSCEQPGGTTAGRRRNCLRRGRNGAAVTMLATGPESYPLALASRTTSRSGRREVSPRAGTSWPACQACNSYGELPLSANARTTSRPRTGTRRRSSYPADTATAASLSCEPGSLRTRTAGAETTAGAVNRRRPPSSYLVRPGRWRRPQARGQLVVVGDGQAVYRATPALAPVSAQRQRRRPRRGRRRGVLDQVPSGHALRPRQWRPPCPSPLRNPRSRR
jgi:hypothetical protein